MRHLPVWDGIAKERSYHLLELLLASPGLPTVFETLVGWLAPCGAVTESSTFPSPSTSTSLSPSAVPSASASPGAPPFPTSQRPSLPPEAEKGHTVVDCYIIDGAATGNDEHSLVTCISETHSNDSECFDASRSHSTGGRSKPSER
jgi:hypothetical protein